MRHEITVPRSLFWEIVNSEAESSWMTSRRYSLSMVNRSLDGCAYPMNTLKRYLGERKLSMAKVLELGCGNGFSLCYMLKNGVDAVGVEPGSGVGFAGRSSRALRLLKANNISDAPERVQYASAEHLPFPDCTFDVVFSVAVLEHVRDLDAAMRESIRILKHGGLLWANLPDYSSNYEAHYDLMWPPPQDKVRARQFVESKGRDPSLIDELTFTTPEMFHKYLSTGTTHGLIYRYGRNWTNAIFTAYNGCCCPGLLPDNRNGVIGLVIGALRQKTISKIAKPLLEPCVKLLQRKGYSSVFDLVLYKEGR